MARRGQISSVLADGPLAFDNAVPAAAAKEKGIVSEVAGDVDFILVPDLVSGSILVKNLEYLANATLAGVVVGLAAPVILKRFSALYSRKIGAGSAITAFFAAPTGQLRAARSRRKEQESSLAATSPAEVDLATGCLFRRSHGQYSAGS